MPVISSNALVSVLDSYSWVGMVSDRTLISMPLNGAAALANHSISFICASFDSTEGWNSLSIHFLAAAVSAYAVPASRADVASDSAAISFLLMGMVSLLSGDGGFASAEGAM